MLEQIDLNQKLDKKTYRHLKPFLRSRLYALQSTSWDDRLPVLIVIEGWDAAGKGASIRALTQSLDPRGFKLYPIRAARAYEKNFPWLWRFWRKLAARGEWAIFDGSWYSRVLVERVEGLTSEKTWRRAYRDIVHFERTLADDGYLILKFWLHISKREQKRRFKKLGKDPLTAWQVTPEDWEHHSKYDDYLQAVEDMLEQTDTEWGPWTIVEATNHRYARTKMLKSIIKTLEPRLGLSAIAQQAVPAATNFEPGDDAQSSAAGGPSPESAERHPTRTPGLSTPLDESPADPGLSAASDTSAKSAPQPATTKGVPK
jgi:AMP-polyphosphate phosphotransferase